MVHRITLEQVLSQSVSNAIKKLYQLVWLTRVWILQDVGLATVATAFWGSCKIDFGEIGEFICHAILPKNLNTVLPQDVKDAISGSPYAPSHAGLYPLCATALCLVSNAVRISLLSSLYGSGNLSMDR